MGITTGIEWTQATWNPWQGCTKVSSGCKNCYMYREKSRYGKDPRQVVRSSKATFNAPMNWRNGKLLPGSKIFVCSWSDYFHPAADAWRAEAWDIIWSLPNFQFLIPTKRPERIEKHLPGDWGPNGYPNVWLGISAEDQKTADKRLPELLSIPARLRFISCEPLLGPIDLRHVKGKFVTFDILNKSRFDYGSDGYGVAAPMPKGLDWVIVGGESGPGCRPMQEDWADDIVRQCRQAGIAIFVKQMGGWPNTRHLLSDLPEELRIREFPRN